MRGIRIKCIRSNKWNSSELKDEKLSEIITVFVKDVVFHHAGLSWIIESKYQIKFNIEYQYPNLIENRHWYNTTICAHFSGSAFEYFFTTAQKCRLDCMCYIYTYENLHTTRSYSVSDGGIILLPDGSKSDYLKSLCNTLNFIVIWL